MYQAIVLAQSDAPAPEGGGAASDQGAGGGGFGGLGGMMLPMLLIVVLMYLMLFRPQRKQEKKRQEMLAQIGKNDRAVTIGGIHGVVYSVTDSDVVLKVDERNDVRIKVAKSAIARIVTDEETDEKGEGEKK